MQVLGGGGIPGYHLMVAKTWPKCNIINFIVVAMILVIFFVCFPKWMC